MERHLVFLESRALLSLFFFWGGGGYSTQAHEKLRFPLDEDLFLSSSQIR